MGSVCKQRRGYITHPISNFHISIGKKKKWKDVKIIIAASLLQHFSRSQSILRTGVSYYLHFFITQFVVIVFPATVKAISSKWWFSCHQSHGTHSHVNSLLLFTLLQQELIEKEAPAREGYSIIKIKSVVFKKTVSDLVELMYFIDLERFVYIKWAPHLLWTTKRNCTSFVLC